MPNYEEAYAGTSGLRDDFIGTIKVATFTYDQEYNDGQTLIARLEVEADDGENIVLKLSTGSGWEDDAKGVKAKREDGKDPGRGFNKSCNYYQFFHGALETDYHDHMVKTAPPWDMTVWDGEPSFHFGTIELPPVEKGGNPRNVLVPVEYLKNGAKTSAKRTTKSRSDDSDDAAETPAQRAKRLAAEKKAAKEADEGGDDDSADLTLLKSIASEADTHEEFMERAYGELENADALEESIVDEDWYNANH